MTPLVLLLGPVRPDRAPLALHINIGLGLFGGVIVLSALGSSYVTQSLEACLIPLGSLAIIPLVVQILNADPASPQDLRTCLQKMIGAFGIAFAAVSLFGWTAGTLLPEWVRYSSLNDLVGHATAAFHPLQVRNEFPLGHANYTAGLALIMLPWQIGLIQQSERKQRGI